MSQRLQDQSTGSYNNTVFLVLQTIVDNVQ